jgi:antitoxin MazE
MNLYVRRWGNSAAVRIPAAILEAAGLKPDDPVELHQENGRIVIEKARRPRHDLDDLVAAISPDNLHEACDWGAPAGKEAW